MIGRIRVFVAMWFVVCTIQIGVKIRKLSDRSVGSERLSVVVGTRNPAIPCGNGLLGVLGFMLQPNLQTHLYDRILHHWEYELL